jgi:hypothetical protein
MPRELRLVPNNPLSRTDIIVCCLVMVYGDMHIDVSNMPPNVDNYKWDGGWNSTGFGSFDSVNWTLCGHAAEWL